MVDDIAIYIGLDVSKEKIAVGLAEAGRKGEVRYYGEIANRADAVRKLAEKLAGRHGRLCFCYEAGPTGYGLYRQLSGLGHECLVVAPSLVPTVGWQLTVRMRPLRAGLTLNVRISLGRFSD